jgi:hypothetical protein
MTWTITEGGGTCQDTEWAVIDDATGETAGCHATEAEAQSQVTALEANGADAAASTELPARFSTVVILEGQTTTDGREIAPGSLGFRTLPLPLMLLTETGWGHDGARLAGAIDTLELVNGEWIGAGSFDLAGEAGAEASRLVASQMLRWVSADLEATGVEYVLVDENGAQSDIPLEDLWEIPDGYRVVERVTEGNIMGATVCPFPAFPQAVIVPEGQAIAAAQEHGREAATALGFTGHASRALVAAGGPERPPRAWFADPLLEGPTPLTVTDDGRVFGHAALWGTCHIGREGVCLTPPRSEAEYAYFRTGEITTDDGDTVPVGQITVGTGHAALSAGARDAAAHYDHTGTAVGDVAAGEDEWGVWLAGAIRPGASEEAVRVLRASAISGDWRKIGGNLELVAALAVNVPGFPVPRTSAGVNRDRQVALVAAGILERDPTHDRLAAMQARLDVFERALRPLLPLAVEQIVASATARASA